MSTKPLHGIKVLDLTRVLAGPFCTMVLADLGADVVKVERPDGGDDGRHFGPFLPSGESGYFASVNRGKRSIALDLKDATDRDTFLALADKSDVLVENFRPGTMERLGFGSAALRSRNPGLIYTSVTGFGRTGPDADQAAYDVIVQARSGLMSVTGHDPDEPVRVGSSISDILAGLYAAIGVCASLRERDATGRGADLDLAMLDCSVSILENAIARFVVSGLVPEPLGTRHPSIAPFAAFRAQDGSLVIAAGNDPLWQTLCRAIGAPELLADPLLSSNRDRAEHAKHLEQAINARLAAKTVAEWLTILGAAGVPCGPINDLSHVLTDPQLEQRGMWHTLRDADGYELVTAGTPFTIDGAKPPLAPAWPTLGADRETVLGDWGIGRTAEAPSPAPALSAIRSAG
ncbi:MAG: CoA transferase [Planctomycetia bacterium]